MTQKPDDIELDGSAAEPVENGSVSEAVDDIADALADAQEAEQVAEEEQSTEALSQALETAQAESLAMKDAYLRAKAEMENVRKRSENEVLNARKFAIENFAMELLTVKDSLDQATKVELDDAASEAVGKMKEGLELTLKQLDTAFSKFAVTQVEAATGVKFNPDQHQAISMVPSEEVENNHIVDVVQSGYMLKERLLRPAMVVVAKSA